MSLYVFISNYNTFVHVGSSQTTHKPTKFPSKNVLRQSRSKISPKSYQKRPPSGVDPRTNFLTLFRPWGPRWPQGPPPDPPGPQKIRCFYMFVRFLVVFLSILGRNWTNLSTHQSIIPSNNQSIILGTVAGLPQAIGIYIYIYIYIYI